MATRNCTKMTTRNCTKMATRNCTKQLQWYFYAVFVIGFIIFGQPTSSSTVASTATPKLSAPLLLWTPDNNAESSSLIQHAAHGLEADGTHLSAHTDDSDASLGHTVVPVATVLDRLLHQCVSGDVEADKDVDAHHQKKSTSSTILVIFVDHDVDSFSFLKKVDAFGVGTQPDGAVHSYSELKKIVGESPSTVHYYLSEFSAAMTPLDFKEAMAAAEPEGVTDGSGRDVGATIHYVTDLKSDPLVRSKSTATAVYPFSDPPSAANLPPTPCSLIVFNLGHYYAEPPKGRYMLNYLNVLSQQMEILSAAATPSGNGRAAILALFTSTLDDKQYTTVTGTSAAAVDSTRRLQADATTAPRQEIYIQPFQLAALLTLFSVFGMFGLMTFCMLDTHIPTLYEEKVLQIAKEY